MLSNQEKRELALLCGRAYGRGDTIDDAALTRLRELEARAAGRPGGQAAVSEMIEGTPDETGRHETDSADTREDGGTRSSARRRRGVLLAIAAAVAGIALGSGITAAVWTPSPTVVATNRDARLSPSAAEQLPEVAELGDWDTGSLAVLGGLDATTIWAATREDGEETCVIVYSATENQGLTVVCADTATVTEDGVTGVLYVYDEGESSAVFGFRANPALDPGVVFRRQ